MKSKIAFIVLALVAGIVVWSGAARFQSPQSDANDRLSTTPLPELITSPGNLFVAQKAKELAAFGPVQAKVRAETRLFDQSIRASGIYIQQGQGSPKTRTELRFGKGNESTYFIQIHDGRLLHTMFKGESPDGEIDGEYRFVDLEKVDWDRVRNNGVVAGPFAWSFVGGLPSLLDHCAIEMEFTAPTEVTLESIDAIEVTGHWRDATIRRLLEGQIDESTGPIQWDQIPAHFPSGVKLTFSNPKSGQTAFLHRIEFFQYHEGNSRREMIPIAIFDLFEVGRLQKLPDTTFKISNDEFDKIDDTELYQNRMMQFGR
jgi:hypothetical protein